MRLTGMGAARQQGRSSASVPDRAGSADERAVGVRGNVPRSGFLVDLDLVKLRNLDKKIGSKVFFLIWST